MAITREQLLATLPSVLKSAPTQYINLAPAGSEWDPALRQALYTSQFGALPEWQQFSGERDGWGMDEFGAFSPDLLNPDNLEVVGYDANGNFQVKLKTADKEGTVYTYAKQPDGTYALQDAGSSQYWDTNQGILEDPIALAMLMGVGGIAAGGIGAAAGLWSDPLAAGAAGGTAAGGAGGAGGAAGAAAPIATTFDPLVPALGFQGANDAVLLAAGGAGAPSMGSVLGAALPGGAALTDAALAGAALGGGTLGGGVLSGVAGGASGAAGTGAGAAGAGAAGAGAAAGSSKLVDALVELTGMSPAVATTLLATVPAIGALVSNLTSGDDTTTSTQGSPAQQAARDTIATTVTGRLPEYMARDRQRADQQMAWANAAALVPQGFTTPPQVFGANGTGMMGNYRPKGLFG